ncbi:hypothetical protein B566_EDAN017958, partial [Ephemera danica]
MPTYFYQQVQQFFDLIFNAVRDPKAMIREGAVEALRAALVVTAQRETAKQAQKPLWYKQCYDEAVTGFEEPSARERGVSREDRIHGSLLVLNELLRCGNTEWERKYEGLKQRLQFKPSPVTGQELGLSSRGRVRSPLVAKSHNKTYAANTTPVGTRHGMSESAACRQLMMEHLDFVCRETLSNRASRSSHIQAAILNMLPRLAAFNRSKFVHEHKNQVTTELREVSVEEWTAFMDEFNRHILEMVSSTDINEKKGGILAIVYLIGADVGKINTRISRFANYLRNLLPCNDVSVMELTVKAMGKVLVLRELAVSMPTYFYQQVQQFFDLIFNAVRDPKAMIREGAVEALRAALVVTAQRETAKQAQKPLWYKQCYDEAVTGFEEPSARERGVSREDRIHGSLLVLNELLRCGNTEWERKYEGLKQRLQFKPSPVTGQ